MRFKLDPHQPSLFLFCGRRKDRIKGLHWDKTKPHRCSYA
ncbi:IS66 family insertion sequence element accessory protein TnpB [Selenomonas sp. GACV-9]